MPIPRRSSSNAAAVWVLTSIFDVYAGEQLQTYAQAGVLWDVTEAARQGGFSAAEDLWPSAREEVTYEGRQYSYPCNLGASILFYNKNVFDHFGAPYPEGILTWDEFLALGKRVGSPANTGQISIHAVTGLSWQVFFESLGGQFFAEDGTPRIADSPELTRSLEMYRDYIFAHKLMPTALELRSMSGQGGWGSGGLNQFAGGRFAMIITGEWAIIGLTRTYEKPIARTASEGHDACRYRESPGAAAAARMRITPEVSRSAPMLSRAQPLRRDQCGQPTPGRSAGLPAIPCRQLLFPAGE